MCVEAWLSQHKIIDMLLLSNLIFSKICPSYISSVVWIITWSSAFALDHTTTFCFLLFHQIILQNYTISYSGLPISFLKPRLFVNCSSKRCSKSPNCVLVIPMRGSIPAIILSSTLRIELYNWVSSAMLQNHYFDINDRFKLQSRK